MPSVDIRNVCCLVSRTGRGEEDYEDFCGFDDDDDANSYGSQVKLTLKDGRCLWSKINSKSKNGDSGKFIKLEPIK